MQEFLEQGQGRIDEGGLKAAIVAAHSKFDKEEVRRALGNFEKRLQQCVEAKGGIFEI